MLGLSEKKRPVFCVAVFVSIVIHSTKSSRENWWYSAPVSVRATDINTMHSYSQPPTVRRCRCPVSFHCHSAGALAENFGNSALLLSNTIPSHIKHTNPERTAYVPELKTSCKMFQRVKSDSASTHVQRALQGQKFRKKELIKFSTPLILRKIPLLFKSCAKTHRFCGSHWSPG